MALQLGIQLASSQTNNYLTDAKYIRGGYLVVESIEAIDERWYDVGEGGVIVEGSLCYDSTAAKFFKYSGSGLAEGWEELKFSPDLDGKTITLNGDNELSIVGFSGASAKQVPTKDTAGNLVWQDVSGLIPDAVVPVSDNETINVAQDPTDNTKYIISIRGKSEAVDKSVLRKHISGSGSSQVVTYTWDEIYSKEEADAAIEAAIDDLGELAHADTASGTVASQTISGVKASGNLIGVATITKTDVQASKVATAGTLPTFTAGVFTPNTPTVIDTSKFNGGSIATYEHTGFDGGSLGNSTKEEFCYEGVVVGIDSTDTECLTFTNAAKKNAVTEQGTFVAATYGTDNFSGGTAASILDGFYTAGVAASKTADVFTQGAMPTFDTVDASNITNTSASVAIDNAQLDVGDIVVSEKSVTVSPDKE